MFQAGDRVVYVPTHAEGDRNHPDCERGKVSSVNDAPQVPANPQDGRRELRQPVR